MSIFKSWGEILRRVYINRQCLITFNKARSIIAEAITDAIPFAAGKLGGTETRAIFHADRLLQLDWPYSMSWLKYARQLYLLSGVFPIDKTTFQEFADHYRFKTLPYVDYMFLWQSNLKEILLAKRHARDSLFSLGYYPEFQSESWTKCLEGKNVLVVSPFVKSIESQYKKREAIWREMPGFLPSFKLLT